MKLELINGLTQLQSLKNVSIAIPYFRPSSTNTTDSRRSLTTNCYSSYANRPICLLLTCQEHCLLYMCFITKNMDSINLKLWVELTFLVIKYICDQF